MTNLKAINPSQLMTVLYFVFTEACVTFRSDIYVHLLAQTLVSLSDCLFMAVPYMSVLEHVSVLT